MLIDIHACMPSTHNSISIFPINSGQKNRQYVPTFSIPQFLIWNFIALSLGTGFLLKLYIIESLKLHGKYIYIYIYIWHFSRENYSVDTWRVENIIGFPCVSGCHWCPLLLSWPSCMHTFWIQQQDKLFKAIEQNPFEFGKLFLVHQKERGTKVLKILELMWN